MDDVIVIPFNLGRSNRRCPAGPGDACRPQPQAGMGSPVSPSVSARALLRWTSASSISCSSSERRPGKISSAGWPPSSWPMPMVASPSCAGGWPAPTSTRWSDRPTALRGSSANLGATELSRLCSTFSTEVGPEWVPRDEPVLEVGGVGAGAGRVRLRDAVREPMTGCGRKASLLASDMTDEGYWVRWHAAYEDPTSFLSRRLSIVQKRLGLTARPGSERPDPAHQSLCRARSRRPRGGGYPPASW